MGKGGVGKTTISVLLAMLASRLGKKVLIVEAGDGDVIGRLFDKASLTETPIHLTEKIWGAHVNPKAELEAYTRAHINPGFIANRITRSRLFDYLFAATPGLKEVMSLGRIWRWEKYTGEDSTPLFDLIIVDSPATGHALSLLRLPMQLIQMIRVGPIVSQIQELQGLLQNRQKTCLALVTLPEELPVNEAIELYSVAESTLNIPVMITFINSVWPEAYNPEEQSEITNKWTSLKSRDTEQSYMPLLNAAINHIHRRNLQQKYMDQIKSEIRSPVVEVPFYFTNDLSLKDIEQISVSISTSSVDAAG